MVAAFEKQKTTAEIAEILKTLYHGGNGLGSVSAWYAEDGIHLSHGKSVRYDRSAQVISWESAAERIGELLESGQFASNVELAEVAGYERSLLAEKLWYLYHDLSEGAREAGYLSCLSEIKGNGFPEETRRLTEQLSDPAFRQTLKEEYAAFWTAYQQDRDLLRFHYHRPREIWENLKDLDLPRRTFSSDLSQVPTVQHFITEDEIDAAMTGGSSFAGGKGRIYAFFMANHTDKEKVRFLKDEYGIGGRSHALSGATHSGEDHDGKGLHYKKQDCPDVHLNWEKVAKRITSLVQKGRYLTEQEQAQYDKIQAEKELAEEDAIQAQQPEVEEETPKPTLREQFEQYKTVVTAAISEDAAYRNACGHSDRENAVIEGNAAVRRAVLGSKDMELIRLYSDIPEFRQRLHREVIDETYPKLHELLRPLSQEDMLKDPAAAVNVPLLVNNYKEAVEAVGYNDDFEAYTLCECISAAFSVVGVAPMVLINVLDPAKHKADISEKTMQVNDGVAVLDEVGVLLEGLTIKADATPLEAGKDYTTTWNNDGTLNIVLLKGGAGEKATTLTATGSKIDPSKVKAADIVGGVDISSGKETGLEVVRQVYPKLSMTPGILLAPRFSADATVSAALQAKTKSINSVFGAVCIC